MRYLLLLCLLWVAACVYGAPEHPELSFALLEQVEDGSVDMHYLKTYDKKQISVTGFLLQSPHGDWVLASTPHLKSCCIGAKHQAMKQIFVQSDAELEAPTHIVTLCGEFTVAPTVNEEGEMVKTYFLHHATVQAEPKKIPVLTLVLAVVVIAFWLLRRKKQKSKC